MCVLPDNMLPGVGILRVILSLCVDIEPGNKMSTV